MTLEQTPPPAAEAPGGRRTSRLSRIPVLRILATPVDLSPTSTEPQATDFRAIIDAAIVRVQFCLLNNSSDSWPPRTTISCSALGTHSSGVVR